MNRADPRGRHTRPLSPFEADMRSPDSDHPSPTGIPLGQRLYDRWGLLLAAGIAIMLIVYTGWGLWEILTLPTATLP